MGNGGAVDADHEAALIIEGSAMRSVFLAGLLGRFCRKDSICSIYIGVSAGACTLAAFLAGRTRMSLEVYLDLALRHEFISFRRFLRGGHLLDLDRLLAAAFAQSSLDVPAIFGRGSRCTWPDRRRLGRSEVGQGRSGRPDRRHQGIDGAAALLSRLSRGRRPPMTDGGIPVRRATHLGTRRIMVVHSGRAATESEIPGCTATSGGD